MTKSIENNSKWVAAPWVPPTTMLGMAFLAGSTRLIHVFKGASRGGLLLTAGCASMGTLWYDTHHQNPQNPLAGRSIVILLGSLISLLAAQPLKGRLSLSLGATCKFTLLEISLVAYSSLKSIKKSPLPALIKCYQQFTSNPETWKKLTPQKRTVHVNLFYKNNLPLLPLTPDLPLDLDNLEIDLTKPTPSSPEQSAWLQEILLSQDPTWIPKLELDDANWDKTFITQFFTDHLEIAYLLDGSNFNKLGIDPVFRHIIPPLMRQTPAQIQALSRAQIQGIHTFTGHYYIKNLTYPQQRTFSERFTSYNLNPKTLQNTDDGSERKSID